MTMVDVFTPKERSQIMAKVRGKDTKPEIKVRSLIHRLGYRFRLQRKDLPGKPDIVLPRHRKVVFVHGCFWHGHKHCKHAERPKSNTDYWNTKIDRNIKRDKKSVKELVDRGWEVLTIWECQTKSMDKLSALLDEFLESHNG